MNASRKKVLVWSLIALLLVLRHDLWFWSDTTLVFGFVPIGLLWQAMVSVGAGIGWYLVSTHAWPEHIERWADEREDSLEGRIDAGGGA